MLRKDILCFALLQSIGKNYAYAEKYNHVQGLRLATSSEFDSSFGTVENAENIQLHKMPKFRGNKKVTGQVNICSGQANEPDKLGNSPFHPSAYNSPIHIRSSYAVKDSFDKNQSPPAYSFHGDKSTESFDPKKKSLKSCTDRASVLKINPSQLFSPKLTNNSDPKTHCQRSCKDDPICNAKFSRLTSELENAKKQVQYLEDILKMKDLEDDENGSSTDADFVDLDQGMQK